jgi:hypothetical protein
MGHWQGAEGDERARLERFLAWRRSQGRDPEASLRRRLLVSSGAASIAAAAGLVIVMAPGALDAPDDPPRPAGPAVAVLSAPVLGEAPAGVVPPRMPPGDDRRAAAAGPSPAAERITAAPARPPRGETSRVARAAAPAGPRRARHVDGEGGPARRALAKVKRFVHRMPEVQLGKAVVGWVKREPPATPASRWPEPEMPQTR